MKYYLTSPYGVMVFLDKELGLHKTTLVSVAVSNLSSTIVVAADHCNFIFTTMNNSSTTYIDIASADEDLYGVMLECDLEYISDEEGIDIVVRAL